MAGRAARRTIAVVVLLTLAVVVLVAVLQTEKWTCRPPDAVWVEGPDHCMELP